MTFLRNLLNLRYLGGLHQDVWVCCWRREDEETTSLETENIKTEIHVAVYVIYRYFTVFVF